MSQSGKRKSRKPRGHGLSTGMSPGTMVFIGEPKLHKPRLDVIHYSETTLDERPDASVTQCTEFAARPGVTWVNVNGIHSLDLIEALGKSFDLHPLTMEDIVNTSQRLKVEDFPTYLFIVMKMVSYDEVTNKVDVEHISLILGDHYVLSFLEDEGDVFDSVRNRIRTNKGRIRMMDSDYLAYALMDAVVDHYFLAVERIGDRIEDIDDQILANPQPEDIATIHRLKRDILRVRKAVWPLREGIGALEKDESGMIHPDNKVFWRDLYDHTIQVIDMVDNFRDILGGVHDTYLSGTSNRMNEVMKVLTIISTLFIPLTFIVGVYGMNFRYMPELTWPYGYYIIWGIMLGVSVGLLVYFKRKKWL